MRWVRSWRSRWVYYWLSGERPSLGFVAMSSLPVLVLGTLIGVAYLGRGGGTPSARSDNPRDKELRCLAENIYYEARGEPLAGQYAVAEVTMNRVASPHYPDTVCEVVFDTRWDPLRRRHVAHFSWTELPRRGEPRGRAWEQATAVAKAVYDELHRPLVPNALLYHADTIRPYWANRRRTVATIGNHVFYR
jgi:N-acetylmuramoyl-L-alanine amidase